MTILHNMFPAYINIQAGKTYKVVKKPEDKLPEEFSILGMSGECLWTNSIQGACLKIAGIDTLVPFDCVEEVRAIDDSFLITAMLADPDGTLKLLRGLWRMTKNPTIRNFMERGNLPEFEGRIEPKSRAEFDNDWDDYARSAGMMLS
jgi:hypothetical protein